MTALGDRPTRPPRRRDRRPNWPSRPGRPPTVLAVAVASVLALVAAVVVGLTTAHRPFAGSVFTLDGSVLTNGGGLSYGGTITPPGLVANFPLEVLNASSSPVTLENATLVPLPGYPVPTLVHLGVLSEHVALLSSTVGWPPEKNHSPGSTWLVRPLRGYIVLPWATRQRLHLGPMPDMIEYGVLGARTNTDYWAAGLRVTYRVGAFTYTQTLYEGGRDCVGNVSFSKPASFQQVYNKYCAAIEQPGNSELMRIAPPLKQ